MPMKVRLLILFIILFTATAWAQKANNAAVTYVANEGFLIKTNNHKILLDALFGGIKGDWCDQPEDSVLAKIINGTAPFDNVDLVFVSHAHIDHFNQDMLVKFLMNNRNARLVCPEQANIALKKNTDYSIVRNRINSIKSRETFDTSLTFNKVKVRALRMDHGSYYLKDSVSGEFVNKHKNVENLAYIIESGGFTFLHTGDGAAKDKKHFETYKIKNTKIDVTFLDRVFMNTEGIDIIKDFLNTRYLAYMHIEPGNLTAYKGMKNVPGDKFKLLTYRNRLEKMIINK